MTETKFTPGPWSEVKNDDQEWRIDAPNGDPHIGHKPWRGMVTVYGCDDFPVEGEEVAEANARLIAAAPDLLESLTNLVGLAKLGAAHLDKYHAALSDAEAAIAKARGES